MTTVCRRLSRLPTAVRRPVGTRQHDLVAVGVTQPNLPMVRPAVPVRRVPVPGQEDFHPHRLGPCDGGDVMLRGPESVRAHLTELCEWTLPPIPPGLYEIVLRLGADEVTIENLRVGQ